MKKAEFMGKKDEFICQVAMALMISSRLAMDQGRIAVGEAEDGCLALLYVPDDACLLRDYIFIVGSGASDLSKDETLLGTIYVAIIKQRRYQTNIPALQFKIETPPEKCPYSALGGS